MNHLANAAALAQAQERLHEVSRKSATEKAEAEKTLDGRLTKKQVKPADKPEVKLYFTMSRDGEKKGQTWGYVDTDKKVWPQRSDHIWVGWEVSGGSLEIKHGITIPEDKITIIFYIPRKKQSEWNQYISTYKGGRLMNLISEYPRSSCKSYIMIGRDYQAGDGEIIDFIHDMSQKF
jgi:hypothetical protein